MNVETVSSDPRESGRVPTSKRTVVGGGGARVKLSTEGHGQNLHPVARGDDHAGNTLRHGVFLHSPGAVRRAPHEGALGRARKEDRMVARRMP